MADKPLLVNLASKSLITDPQDSDTVVMERNGNINRATLKTVLEKTTGTLSDTVTAAQEAAAKLEEYTTQTDELVEKLNATDVSKIENRVTAIEAKVSDLTNAADKYVGEYCGRYWDFNNATPTAAGYVGNLQMLKDLPTLLGLGGYLVKNDHTRRKLSSVDHHFYEDGTPAKLDGSEGHYQAGWNRKWYVLWEWDETTKILTEKIRISPAVGYYEVPIGSDSASGYAALDRTNLKLVSYCNTDAQYRGGNNNTAYDGQYNSLLGKPATAITTANFMAYAKKNGTGWLCSTGRMFAAWAFLFYAIMGTLNVQASVNKSLDSNGLRQGGLGGGSSYGYSAWATLNGNNPFLPMEAGADVGDAVGTFQYTITTDSSGTTKTFNVPVFFGYKNFYTYLWRLTCDEFLSNNSDYSQTHYQTIAPYYNDFTFATIDSKHVKGTTGPVEETATWLWTTRLALNGFEMMPTAVGGSSTTYFSDGYYPSGAASGLRLVLRSANANNGDHGGFACLSGSNSGVSGAYADGGSSLSEVCSEFKVTPLTAEDLDS